METLRDRREILDPTLYFHLTHWIILQPIENGYTRLTPPVTLNMTKRDYPTFVPFKST
jgi:hypothetical protein